MGNIIAFMLVPVCNALATFCTVLWGMSIVLGISTIIGKALTAKKTVTFSKKDICIIACMLLPISAIIVIGAFFRLVYVSLSSNKFIGDYFDVDIETK